ncbi:MAG TPA: hypothetical protein DCS63_00900 [Elusimicrobia bacterium]|nr:hypothetical protein [Elusimicrobiota bacterium]
MEKGLKLGPGAFRDRAALRKSLKPFSWAYFGSEFCENLLLPELTEELRALSGEQKNVCLLTPLVTEKGLGALEKLFTAAMKMSFAGRFEVSVNDFGVLGLIRRLRWGVPVSLGRQLARNFTLPAREGPEILNSDGLAVLEELRIWRLDVSLFPNAQKSRLAPGNEKLRFTAFYPYLDVAAARTCMLGMPALPPGESADTVRCALECRHAVYRVRNEAIREDLIVGGNAVFVECGGPIPVAKGRLIGVDRFVFCPDT